MTDALHHQARWYADNIPLQGQFVVDVGANVGRLSQAFWDAGKGTNRVLSVEPLEENVATIRARIEQAETDQWTVVQGAVSAEDGNVSLRVADTPGEGRNSIVTADGTRTTAAHRLTTLAPEATVVKLDIEGHEYVVLDQALIPMDKVHSWAIEFHLVEDRPLEVALSGLAKAGFRLYAATHRPDDRSGAWVSAEIAPSLTWASVPVARRGADGHVVKTLHVIARHQTRGCS